MLTWDGGGVLGITGVVGAAGPMRDGVLVLATICLVCTGAVAGADAGALSDLTSFIT
ncbi:MAG: hypothetical protein KDK97_10330 [Verrucomicrobiales bacterium]|nr:hypothetical protein [Verrucomicrobiales bacterium]